MIDEAFGAGRGLIQLPIKSLKVLGNDLKFPGVEEWPSLEMLPSGLEGLRRPAILLLVAPVCYGSSCLKSLRIRVPEVVKSGDVVTLSCEYDLEQVALYTIKWYWKDVEFYRFVPKESPPFRAFTMKYINVDISRSGPTQVTLRGVRRELTGDYKCEVSADGPLFHTDIKVGHMIVAELPNGNPAMNIDPNKVEIGKTIRAECYSPGSDPPANLTWYINDEKVTEDNESAAIISTEVETDKALGLHSSKSVIEITTTRAHFASGLMAVKCEANIYALWLKVAEDHVRDDTPHLAPVLGSTSSHSQVDEINEVQNGAAGLKLSLLPAVFVAFR